MSNVSVEAEAVAARALITENRRNILDLTMDLVANQAQIEDLVKANCKLSDMVYTS